MTSEYIIDFVRMNELTSHPNDNPSGSNGFASGLVHNLTRKVIKEYLDTYLMYKKDEKWQRAVETLHYNGILKTAADIRDGKINTVLN